MPALPQDRIDALARPDKWYLGGLDGVVWAPPFPRRLDRPGFWDPVHLLQHEVGPGFAVALLDEGGREIALRGGPALDVPGGRRVHDARAERAAETRETGDAEAAGQGGRDRWRWRPGRLAIRWTTRADRAGAAGGAGAVLLEERQVRAGGVLESVFGAPRELDGMQVVAFTAQPASAVADLGLTDCGVGWTRTVTDRQGRSMAVRMQLAGPEEAVWRGVVASEGRATPAWRLSPFAELGARGLNPPGRSVSPAAAQTTGTNPSESRGIHGVGPDEARRRRLGAQKDAVDSAAVGIASVHAGPQAVGWIWVAVAFRARSRAPLALRLRLDPRLEGRAEDSPPDDLERVDPARDDSAREDSSPGDRTRSSSAPGPRKPPPTPPPGPPSSPASLPSPAATPTSTAASTTASTASDSTASRGDGATSAAPASPRGSSTFTSPSPTAPSAT